MAQFPAQYYDDDSYDDYFPATCGHGNTLSACDDCAEYEHSRGGIDKCMNCGQYKYNDELTYPGQVCRSGCKNPNEY